MSISVLVIVPAYNEEAHIEVCLTSLLRQDVSDFELDVVVVNNGSTDSTGKIIEELNIACIECPDGNIGKVRNRGLDYVDSDVVAYLDADCSVSSDWVKNGIRALQSNPRIGGVQGTLLSPPDGSVFQRIWAPTSCNNKAFEVDHLATGACFFWRRTIIDAGLFDEALTTGEDTDLSKKIKNLGHTLVKRDDCAVIHHGYPGTMRSFFKRQFKQGGSYASFSASLIDKTFVSVMIFGTSLILSLALALAGHILVSIVFASASALVIALYAFYRCFWLRDDVGLAQIHSALFVNFIYFLGRFSGFAFQLVRNFKKLDHA